MSPSLESSRKAKDEINLATSAISGREIHRRSVSLDNPEQYPGLWQLKSGGKLFLCGASKSISTSFVSDLPNWERSDVIQLVKVSNLRANPFNPRKHADPAELVDLTRSIAENGIHTPLNVCRFDGDVGSPIVLSGHRRLYVASALGIDLVPVKIDSRGVLTELELRRSLIEQNEHHANVSPVDRANALLGFMKETGQNQSEAAKSLGLTQSQISRSLKLLDLPLDLQALVNTKQIPEATGYWIARSKEGEVVQRELARCVIEEGRSADWVRRKVERTVVLLRDRASKVVENNSKDLESGSGQRRVSSIILPVPGNPGVRLTISSEKVKIHRAEAPKLLGEVLLQLPVEMPVHHLQKIDTVSEVPEGVLRPEPALQKTIGEKAEPTNQYRSDKLGVVVKFGRIVDGHHRSAASNEIKGKYIDGKPNWDESHVIQLIHKSELTPHPLNPRRYASKQELQELEESIATRGIHTPLRICRSVEGPVYVLGGHRRRHTALKLGFDLLPCRLDAREPLTRAEILKELITDNEHHSPPSPIDRAKSFKDYMAKSGLSPEEFAQEFGLQISKVNRLVRLLTLPDSVQDLVSKGAIKEMMAFTIAEMRGSSEDKARLAQIAVNRKLSLTQVKAIVEGSQFASLVNFRREISVKSGMGSTVKSWDIGGERRIKVTLTSPDRFLSDSEVLESLISFQGQAEETRHEEESRSKAAQDLSSTRIRVRELLGRESRHEEEALRNYLPGLVIEAEGGLEVTSHIGDLLNFELDNDDLDTYGLKLSHNTFLNVVEATNGEFNKDATVTVLELLTYWHTCIEKVRGVNRPTLLLAWMLDHGIDTSTLHENKLTYSSQKIITELTDKLSHLQYIVSERIPTVIASNKRSEDLISGLSNSERPADLMTDEELIAAGFKFPEGFHSSFRAWLGKQKFEKRSSWYIDEGVNYSRSELEAYLVYSMSRIVSFCGGDLKGAIGAERLRRNGVAADGRSKTGIGSIIGVVKILQPLEDNLSILESLKVERS